MAQCSTSSSLLIMDGSTSKAVPTTVGAAAPVAVRDRFFDSLRQFWESVRMTVFVIGGMLLVFACARKHHHLVSVTVLIFQHVADRTRMQENTTPKGETLTVVRILTEDLLE